MKKSFNVEIDCAVCAAKIEDAIGKIDGVDGCTISFVMQKLTLCAAEEKFDDVLKKAIKTARKIEPDFEIEA